MVGSSFTKESNNFPEKKKQHCNNTLKFHSSNFSIKSLFNTEKPGKPDPPKIVQVNKNSVSLRWKPPKHDGRAEITNYVIEYRIKGNNFMFRLNGFNCSGNVSVVMRNMQREIRATVACSVHFVM